MWVYSPCENPCSGGPSGHLRARRFWERPHGDAGQELTYRPFIQQYFQCTGWPGEPVPWFNAPAGVRGSLCLGSNSTSNAPAGGSRPGEPVPWGARWAAEPRIHMAARICASSGSSRDAEPPLPNIKRGSEVEHLKGAMLDGGLGHTNVIDGGGRRQSVCLERPHECLCHEARPERCRRVEYVALRAVVSVVVSVVLTRGR